MKADSLLEYIQACTNEITEEWAHPTRVEAIKASIEQELQTAHKKIVYNAIGMKEDWGKWVIDKDNKSAPLRTQLEKIALNTLEEWFKKANLARMTVEMQRKIEAYADAILLEKAKAMVDAEITERLEASDFRRTIAKMINTEGFIKNIEKTKQLLLQGK